MNVKNIKTKLLWIAEPPTLEKIEEYAIDMLEKDGCIQPLIIMRKGSEFFVTQIPYGCESERNDVRDFLKEIVLQSGIQQYWMVRESWLRSNTSVPPELDEDKKEALLMGEYNIGKKAKTILLQYATKDNDIIFGERLEGVAGELDKWDFYRD